MTSEEAKALLGSKAKVYSTSDGNGLTLREALQKSGLAEFKKPGAPATNPALIDQKMATTALENALEAKGYDESDASAEAKRIVDQAMRDKAGGGR
jgi:hypothetical protein